MESLWQPQIASSIVTISIGVSGMLMLCLGTKRARKVHAMNAFNQLFFALLFMAFLIRSFYWVIWVQPGVPGPDPDDADNDPDDPNAGGIIGISVSIRAFLLTYPSLNMIICSFFLQYPWIFDFIVMQQGRRM